MSGHNKWSKIKHKKAASDAQKSKVFSKHAQLIAYESKKASGDINAPGLRAAIEKAKKDNMPSDNITRAIKKGAGSDAGSMEIVTYEAYGPGGVALVIEGITDNKNRTGAEVKHALSEAGLELAAPGSALWAFAKEGAEWKANATVPVSPEDGEKLSSLIDAIEDLDDIQAVFTNAE